MSAPAGAGAGAGAGKRPMSIRGMFRFADRVDALLMALGTLGAIGDGCSTNLLLIFASDVMNALGYGDAQAGGGGGGAKSTQFMHEVEKSCLNFVDLALVVLAVAFMEGYCWSRTSERQVLRIRYLYLQVILRQEAGFFDSQDQDQATTSEIINSISKDASDIQEVLSEKVVGTSPVVVEDAPAAMRKQRLVKTSSSPVENMWTSGSWNWKELERAGSWNAEELSRMWLPEIWKEFTW